MSHIDILTQLSMAIGRVSAAVSGVGDIEAALREARSEILRMRNEAINTLAFKQAQVDTLADANVKLQVQLAAAKEDVEYEQDGYGKIGAQLGLSVGGSDETNIVAEIGNLRQLAANRIDEVARLHAAKAQVDSNLELSERKLALALTCLKVFADDVGKDAQSIFIFGSSAAQCWFGLIKQKALRTGSDGELIQVQRMLGDVLESHMNTSCGATTGTQVGDILALATQLKEAAVRLNLPNKEVVAVDAALLAAQDMLNNALDSCGVVTRTVTETLAGDLQRMATQIYYHVSRVSEEADANSRLVDEIKALVKNR